MSESKRCDENYQPPKTIRREDDFNAEALKPLEGVEDDRKMERIEKKNR